MDHQPVDYDQLITSFLSGNSDSSENEVLQCWQDLSVENKKTFDDSVKVWENCPKSISKSVIEKDKQFVLGSIISQSSVQQRRDRVVMKFLRMAAIFIGPVMLAIGWNLGNQKSSTPDLTWNTVTAPRKHIAMCTLSDGTIVWLNAGSTLSYPSNIEKDKREVKLTGEGYFKVTKNDVKPFLVITSQATVKVLGTSFNMRAYPGSNQVVTTLEEGSIEFLTQKSGVDATLKLKPGEQAVYNSSEGKIEVNKVDATGYSAWIGDKFLFKDADLKSIIAELERLYDVKIHIKSPRLEKLRFRGMFSYDQDLLDAFETLRRSVKLKYTIKEREIWLE
jgi:transmembrane sensor